MTKEMGEYSGVAAPVSTQYPQYIRDNYTVWATTMMWALESNEVWEAVDPGGGEFMKGAPKYRKDRQALTAICSVMPMDVKQHLISKKSAKEAWETIKTLNLGHERVREAALQTLQKKYENLEMGEDETVDAFASRVATLVNGIRALDEKLEEISIVRRFLRAASPRYLSVVSAIEQCVDLKTLTMDDLVGRFKAHDERMKITYGDVVPEEHVMLTRAQWQAVVAKEKGDKAYDRRSDEEVSRPAKKYIAGEDEDDASPRRKFDIKKIRCHNCGKLGHFKVDCQKPPKPKERALIAQEGDDRPMMLMLEVCEQKDEEELPPPSPATEIVMDHGLPYVDHVDKLCDEGVVEKQRSAPYPRETAFEASEALELVHGDICGPISPATPSGNEYFMLVVDDLSQYMWIVLLKSKDQGLQAFEKIKEAGEVKARAKKSLRIDRGGELKHTVVAMARSMMESKGLPGKFWGEAVNTAVYLLNRAPTRSMVGGTPYEAWYGRKPSVDHLRTFGCVAHVKTVSGHKRNLANRSTPMIMTGYEEGSKAYRLCNPSTNKVIVACDVVFKEDLSWIWSSTEPIRDEIFTVYSSNPEHVDDQVRLKSRVTVDTETASSGDAADSSAAKVAAESRATPSRSPGARGASWAGDTGESARSASPHASPGTEAHGPGSQRDRLQSSSSRPGAQPSWPGGLFVPGRALEGAGASGPSAAHSRPGGTTGSPEVDVGDDFTSPTGSASTETARDSADAETSATSAPASPSTAMERRQLPTPKIFRSVFDLYSPEIFRTMRVRRGGQGRCLLTEEQTRFEDANTEVCWRRATDKEEIAKFKLHMKEIFKKRILENCSMEDCNPTQVLVVPQPTNEGSGSEEISATSDAEEYVVLSPTALEMRRLRPTRARMRCVLDNYPKKIFRVVNNPVKMKHTKQCLFIKEPVKTEDADKEDCRREAREKPAKVKSVTWVPRGTTKAMSRKMPAGSSWRIWDPGRSGVHVVLRGVIVSIKHDNTASWT
ncbi:hypothetical protein QYE76_005581 [Lolium multiflorum]|uniref:CCHC-type domain-containing protein n=1 Tax=Lolium multiflorum TaxID=4521 RepID=A0AAD8RSY8_LOLMU|nr:hypothetical protein QYE76_005581 [Lolium multiflorum]